MAWGPMPEITTEITIDELTPDGLARMARESPQRLEDLLRLALTNPELLRQLEILSASLPLDLQELLARMGGHTSEFSIAARASGLDPASANCEGNREAYACVETRRDAADAHETKASENATTRIMAAFWAAADAIVAAYHRVESVVHDVTSTIKDTFHAAADAVTETIAAIRVRAVTAFRVAEGLLVDTGRDIEEGITGAGQLFRQLPGIMRFAPLPLPNF